MANAAKTTSARNLLGWGYRAWLGIAGILIVVAVGVVIWRADRPAAYEQRTLYAGDTAIRTELADSDEKRTLGLSGRSGLADGTGMFFVFDTSSDLCFWMKDMRFPIDMVWLDSDRRVVRVAANVQPESYPTNYCAPQDKPARYVIEVGAGQAGRLGLRDGVTVRY